MIQLVLLSPKSSEDQKKKGLYRKLKDIYLLNQVKTKKKEKVFKGLDRNLVPYSDETGGIYSC